MTSLDTLARSASAAVHETVAEVSPPVVGATALASATAWRTMKYALAGAAAGAAVVVALVVAPLEDDVAVTSTTVPSPSSTVAEVTPTTVATPATTLPAPETPVVVPPSAEETTTTAADVEPPALVVTSPANGEHLEARSVTFEGTTEPGASVLASGKFDVDVRDDGVWAIDLVLAPGANGVVFAATDAAGNVTEVRLTVHYDADEPKATTTTTKPASWTFTANQKYGSCEEAVPYDEFYGTGKPGSTISVTSSYGSGSTTVSGDGTYWLRVEFPTAPKGESFTVKVKDEYGNKKTFNFVSNH